MFHHTFTTGAAQHGKSTSASYDLSRIVGEIAAVFFDARGDNTASLLAFCKNYTRIAIDELGGSSVFPLEVIGVGDTEEKNRLYEDETMNLFDGFITNLFESPIKEDILRHTVRAYQYSPPEIREKFGASQFDYLLQPKLPQFDEIMEGLPKELWYYFKDPKALHASTHMSTFGSARRPWEMTLGSPEVRKRDVGYGLNWERVEKEKWLVIQKGSKAVSDNTITTLTKLRIAELIRYKGRNH